MFEGEIMNRRARAYLSKAHYQAERMARAKLESQTIKDALIQVLSNQIIIMRNIKEVHHQTKKRIIRETTEVIQCLR